MPQASLPRCAAICRAPCPAAKSCPYHIFIYNQQLTYGLNMWPNLDRAVDGSYGAPALGGGLRGLLRRFSFAEACLRCSLLFEALDFEAETPYRSLLRRLRWEDGNG